MQRLLLFLGITVTAASAENWVRFSTEHGFSEEEARALARHALTESIAIDRGISETIESYHYALDAYKRVDDVAKDSLSQIEYLDEWNTTANMMRLGFHYTFSAARDQRVGQGTIE